MVNKIPVVAGFEKDAGQGLRSDPLEQLAVLMPNI